MTDGRLTRSWQRAIGFTAVTERAKCPHPVAALERPLLAPEAVIRGAQLGCRFCAVSGQPLDGK
jgi:hypothetical protein